MIDADVILAAHGSRHDPGINAAIRGYAQAVSQRAAFSGVHCAFHQGDPAFSTALDMVISSQVIVVPVMASDGYYSQIVLPRELAKSSRCSEIAMTITKPLGSHLLVCHLMSRRLARLIELHRLDPVTTSVVVIGHGTTRHSESANTTHDLVERLRGNPLQDVFEAFLDEPPYVESVLDRACNPTVVVLPFLIASGAHAVLDIPRRLGSNFRRAGSAMIGHSQGQRIIIDEPFGADPCVPELLLDLALSAVHEFDSPLQIDSISPSGFRGILDRKFTVTPR